MVLNCDQLPDSTTIDHLVREYEDSRKMRLSSDSAESKIFTIRLPLEDYSFFQAFADFYGENRSTVVRDVLHSAAFQILAALPVDIRNQIAHQADSIFHKSMIELGLDEKGGDWENWANIFTSRDHQFFKNHPECQGEGA
jgi:hypothetical protein